MKWTETLVIDVLREAYLPREGSDVLEEWALLNQVVLRAGRNERRIDALGVRCSGRGDERIAFEVKVSRQDFRSETPEKRAPAEAVAHLCTYVAPADLIPVGELPAGWGLIEVYETPFDRPPTIAPLGDRAEWRVRPVRRTPVGGLDDLAAVLARRASRTEESIRSGADVPGVEVARLRYDVERLSLALYSAQQQIAAAADAARQARYELLGQAGDQDCADCGQKVTWRHTAKNGAAWTHVKRAHDKPCAKDRAEQDRLAKVAETGAHYGWGFAAPIEPRVFREARQVREATMREAS